MSKDKKYERVSAEFDDLVGNNITQLVVLGAGPDRMNTLRDRFQSGIREFKEGHPELEEELIKLERNGDFDWKDGERVDRLRDGYEALLQRIRGLYG